MTNCIQLNIVIIIITIDNYLNKKNIKNLTLKKLCEYNHGFCRFKIK